MLTVPPWPFAVAAALLFLVDPPSWLVDPSERLCYSLTTKGMFNEQQKP